MASLCKALTITTVLERQVSFHSDVFLCDLFSAEWSDQSWGAALSPWQSKALQWKPPGHHISAWRSTWVCWCWVTGNKPKTVLWAVGAMTSGFIQVWILCLLHLSSFSLLNRRPARVSGCCMMVCAVLGLRSLHRQWFSWDQVASHWYAHPFCPSLHLSQNGLRGGSLVVWYGQQSLCPQNGFSLGKQK